MTLNNAIEFIMAGKSGRCYLGYSNVSDSDLEQVSHALQSGKAAQGLLLNFVYNSISDKGAEYFAQALQSGNAPQDLVLNLENNLISDMGAECFAKALQSGNAPNGLKLYLGSNNVGYIGAEKIAEALQSGKVPANLTLNISGNKFNDSCVKKIAEALQSGNAPQWLTIYFSGSNIGIEGISSITQALQSGNAPLGLCIDLGDKISEESAEKIAKAVAYQNHFNQKQIRCEGLDDRFLAKATADLLHQCRILGLTINKLDCITTPSGKDQLHGSLFPRIMFFICHDEVNEFDQPTVGKALNRI